MEIADTLVVNEIFADVLVTDETVKFEIIGVEEFDILIFMLV